MPRDSANNPPNTSISAIKATMAHPRPFIQTLNIGPKIGLGYAIALGIATLGTVFGLLLGDRVERRAEAKLATFAQAEELINDLQLAILDVRTNEQRLIRIVQEPQSSPFQYSMAKIRVDRADILLSDFERELQEIEANPDLWGRGSLVAQFLLMRQTVATDYLEELNQLMDQGFGSMVEVTPEEVQRAIAEFTFSPTVQRLDEFASQLNELVVITQRLENDAERELLGAKQLRQQILLGSMGVSGLLAIFFATYTSRAIARPLRAVTQVARQVTEDANFDLQAPISTTDEVGVLAYSLNKLIRRVKALLEAQHQAAAAQQRLQQEQILQSEKMSSLGRMMAGVAHEINNPVNFMYGNLTHANRYIEDLLSLIDTYAKQVPDPPPRVKQLMQDIDLEFLVEDLPRLLASMQVGADRTRQIVMSLKNFSRMDEEVMHPVDLVACIDSTLLILNNRIKNGIHVVRDYATPAANIPSVEGYSGLLYQVFMNLMSNALDALDEEQAARQKPETLDHPAAPNWTPTLTLSLARQGSDAVRVTVADNGCGIPEDDLPRIFEAFYTSKPVGVGTGLGLSITREIVEEKHHGTIECRSQPGKGTAFIVTLAIHHAIPKQPAPAVRWPTVARAEAPEESTQTRPS